MIGVELHYGYSSLKGITFILCYNIVKRLELGMKTAESRISALGIIDEQRFSKG